MQGIEPFRSENQPNQSGRKQAEGLIAELEQMYQQLLSLVHQQRSPSVRNGDVVNRLDEAEKPDSAIPPQDWHNQDTLDRAASLVSQLQLFLGVLQQRDNADAQELLELLGFQKEILSHYQDHANIAGEKEGASPPPLNEFAASLLIWDLQESIKSLGRAPEQTSKRDTWVDDQVFAHFIFKLLTASPQDSGNVLFSIASSQNW